MGNQKNKKVDKAVKGTISSTKKDAIAPKIPAKQRLRVRGTKAAQPRNTPKSAPDADANKSASDGKKLTLKIKAPKMNIEPVDSEDIEVDELQSEDDCVVQPNPRSTSPEIVAKSAKKQRTGPKRSKGGRVRARSTPEVEGESFEAQDDCRHKLTTPMAHFDFFLKR